MHARKSGLFLTFSGQGQTANLTLDLSFGHYLCFRCPNGWCEPILDIYVSIVFQWCKDLFKPMGFSPYNRSLKIRKSFGTPTSQVKVALGVWGFTLSHSLAHAGIWNVILGFLSARNFASPCLGHEPKAKVATYLLMFSNLLNINYLPT
jgi:hypothetical protein